MINIQSAIRALQSVKTLQTSTGEVFTKESALDALIRIQVVKKNIEAVEAALRCAIKEVCILPYENADGKVDWKSQSTTAQDVTEIIKAVGLDNLIKMEALKVVKTGLPTEIKKVVEYHETSVEKEPTIVVTLTTKPEGCEDIILQ